LTLICVAQIVMTDKGKETPMTYTANQLLGACLASFSIGLTLTNLVYQTIFLLGRRKDLRELDRRIEAAQRNEQGYDRDNKA
jgi:hypothetical protein